MWKKICLVIASWDQDGKQPFHDNILKAFDSLKSMDNWTQKFISKFLPEIVEITILDIFLG